MVLDSVDEKGEDVGAGRSLYQSISVNEDGRESCLSQG